MTFSDTRQERSSAVGRMWYFWGEKMLDQLFRENKEIVIFREEAAFHVGPLS